MKLYLGIGTFKTALNGAIILLISSVLAGCGGGDGFTGNLNPGAYKGVSSPITSRLLTTTSPSVLNLEAGKSASFTISGGVAPYRVISSNPLVSSATMVDAITYSLTGSTIGTTQVAVFDDVGTSVTVSVTVASSTGSTVLFTTAPNSITIATGAQPSYGIGGGSAPFRVVSNDVSVAAVLSFNDKEFKLQGVKGGAATVVISDSTGATKSVQVTVTPTATTAMLVSPSIVSASVGDELVFKVSGGEPGYGVQVNNTSIASAGSAAVSASGGTFTLNLLKTGTTTIAITDALGQTQTVMLTIGSPPLFTTAPGNITIATGAQPSYGVGGGGGASTYAVISSDVSVVSVVQLKNATEFQLDGVKAGVATVVVSDSTGATKSVQVTVTPTATTPMLVSPYAASASLGDLLVFKVSGGEPGYGVQVNNTSIASPSTSKLSTNGGTFSLNLLKVGSTTIAITDALNQTQTVTLTVDASDAKLRLAPSALTIDENFKDSIAFSIYGGVPGATYNVFSSDQLLFSTLSPSKDTTFLLGPIVSGNRCIVPNNITGIYDVQITVVDQSGASAVSVVSIRDNARGCL